MSLKVLRDAVNQASAPQSVEFRFEERHVLVGPVGTWQLRVTYVRGNEYLRLDRLLDELRKTGKVEVFEFRGRGRDELPTIVADVRMGDKVFQLVYELPNAA